MTCLDPETLAELATRGGDDPHLATCLTCRAALAEQLAIRALGNRLAAPTLPRSRRDALAAEVMAHADMFVSRDAAAEPELAIDPALLVAPGVRALRRAAGGLAALASAAAIALASAPSLTVTPGPLDVATVEVSGVSVRGAAADDPAPPVSPIAAVDDTAELTRAVAGDRDVIALHGGSVTLDSRETRDVDVTARDTVVRVDHAKARVVARAGAIESVAVFAGSVEVTTHGKRQVIEAGAVWVAEPSHGLAPPDPGRTAALQPFLDGWTALRAGHHAAAIAAFDRATDPAVAEDAVYWGAVAAERAGDRADAVRRFADFLARFPESPRVEAARGALDALK